MEIHVHIGEVAVSVQPGDVLACVGLGSCIGVALFDRRATVAGLAHVMLPQSPPGGGTQPCKYADLAVPDLVGQMMSKGALRTRIEAVFVGGAAMFAMGGSRAEIGCRNAEAVAAALQKLQIGVKHKEVGGSHGRTIKVEVGPSMTTTSRIAGGQEAVIYGDLARTRAIAA